MEAGSEIKQGGYLPVENHPLGAYDFFEEKDGIELIIIDPKGDRRLLSPFKVDGVMRSG